MKNTITVYLSRSAQIRDGRVPVETVEVPLADLLMLLDDAGRAELAHEPESLITRLPDPSSFGDERWVPASELAEATPEIVARLIAERASARAAATATVERVRAEKRARENEENERERVKQQELAADARARYGTLTADAELAPLANSDEPNVTALRRADSDFRNRVCAARDREVKRRNSERAAKKAAFAVAARSYVTDHVPEFARAAREGCDVSRHASQHAATSIQTALGSNVDEPYGMREQLCPHASAYEVLDRVQAAAAALLPHPLVDAIQCRIMRGDTCDRRNCEGWRTLVEVTISWADGDTSTQYAYADQEEPHVHDDSDY